MDQPEIEVMGAAGEWSIKFEEEDADSSGSAETKSLLPNRPARAKTGGRVYCEGCKRDICRSTDSVRAHLLRSHMKTRAIRCKFCPFAEIWKPIEISSHNLVKHPDEDMNDFLDERGALHEKIQATCRRFIPSYKYGESGIGMRGHGQRRRLQKACAGCGHAWMSQSHGGSRMTPDQRLGHVILNHQDLFPAALKCRRCPFAAPWGLGDMKRHFVKDHDGQTPDYKDERENVKKQIEDTYIYV